MSVSGTLGIKLSNLFPCILRTMMNLRKQAKEVMEDVTVASKKVEESAEWATVALMAVTCLSLAGLLVAVIALGRASHDR
jgi:hypothetical protein